MIPHPNVASVLAESAIRELHADAARQRLAISAVAPRRRGLALRDALRALAARRPTVSRLRPAPAD